MTQPPTDLIRQFTQSLNEANQIGRQKFAFIDPGLIGVIPAMQTLAQNFSTLYGMMRDREISEQLTHHFALINKDGPVHKAVRYLSGPNVDHAMTPPMPVFDKAGSFELDKLLAGQLSQALDCVHANTKYKDHTIGWSGNILDGMVPSIIGGNRANMEIRDLFAVNPKPFEEADKMSEMRFNIPLRKDDEEHSEYTSSVTFGTPKVTKRPDGQVSMRVSAEILVRRVGEEFWSLRARFGLTYDSGFNQGLQFHWEPRADAPVYDFPLNSIAYFKYGADGVHGLNMPLHWHHKAPLVPHVEMYDKVENAIHYGCAHFIPRAAIRDGIRRWLTATDYYVPQETLTNAQVARELIALADRMNLDSEGIPYYVRRYSKTWTFKVELSATRHRVIENTDAAIVSFLLNYDDYDKAIPPKFPERWKYLDLTSYHSTFNLVTGTALEVFRREEDGEYAVRLRGAHITDRYLTDLMGMIRELTKVIAGPDTKGDDGIGPRAP